MVVGSTSVRIVPGAIVRAPMLARNARRYSRHAMSATAIQITVMTRLA